MVWKKVSSMTGWDEAEYQLEAWSMVCAMFLGNIRDYLSTFEMVTLIKETFSIRLRLREQYRQKTTFSSALLCLTQM